MSRIRLWSGVVLWSVAAVPAGSSAVQPGPRAEEKVVTVEGSAAGTDAPAMEKAKLDALRQAVEQACGTFINAQTKTKDYAAVYDKVMADAVGLVTEFTVLERRVADGVSHCRVRATVSPAQFEAEWARVRHTLEAEGNPRCMVVVVEDDDVDDEAPARADGVVQSLLEKFFLDRGVQLMDRAAGEKVQARDVELAALNNDVKKLAAMAAGFRADVVVAGRAEARQAGTTELAGRTLHQWTATLTVRAYAADSAQLLLSNTYTVTQSGVHRRGGGGDVLRRCAEENAGKVLQDLGRAWARRQNVRRTCRVTMENCSRADYQAFEAALRPVQGVQEVRLRELVNDVCTVEVDWAYDLERLIDAIERLKVPDARYRVTEQSHDRVTLRRERVQPPPERTEPPPERTQP